MTKTAAPTRGRVIEVTSNLWHGKRPAIIVAVVEPAGDGQNPGVRANILLDGETDHRTLDYFRGRATGNTVTLEYGVQNPDATLPVPGDRDWFCGWWMPFQVGMAPASLAVQGELTELKEKVLTLCSGNSVIRVLPGSDPQSLAIDRLKDALGFLAQKLNKSSPDHPRANLYSGVMRILDGKDAEQPDAAQPAPPEPVTQTSTA